MGLLKSMLGSIVTKTMGKKLISKTITEDDLKPVLRELRVALLDGDVNLLIVKKIINKIKEKCLDEIIVDNISPSEFVINSLKETLVEVLGSNKVDFNLNKKPLKIMFVGLNGSGKTTSVGKIANYFKIKNNKNSLLVGLDIYRPAAQEQLKTLANSINQLNYNVSNNNFYDDIVNSLEISAENKVDCILYDTAGRLQTNDELMLELKQIKKIVKPDEILFVVDAMAGQDITNVAQKFHDELGLTGIIVTKLDSDARAGAVLSLVSLLNIPIKVIGNGEKISDLDVFYPDRIADRILGLGDIVTLAEKAANNFDEKQAKGMITRMLAGKMNLEDLLNQTKQISSVGSLGSIVNMIPGLNKLKESSIEDAELKIKIWTTLINSMTIQERRNPKLILKNFNRRNRILKGSGRKPDELNKLLKQWETTNKHMVEIGKKMQKGINPFSSIMK